MASLHVPDLPLPLAALVVEFAVRGFTQELAPVKRSLPPCRLETLALVSKSWHQLTRQLLAQLERETMQLHVGTGRRSELLAIRRDVALRGRGVRDLRLSLGLLEDSDQAPTFTVKFYEIEDAAIDWDAIFVHLPGLKRLNLKLVPLESRHLPKIIEAAAKRCVQMEVLILPGKVDLEQEIKGSAIQKVMEVLYAAMKRWYKKGSCGGLRQLTVPTRDEEERCRCSTEFIENVTRFCPNIEYLDGCEEVLHEQEQVKCEEKDLDRHVGDVCRDLHEVASIQLDWFPLQIPTFVSSAST